MKRRFNKYLTVLLAVFLCVQLSSCRVKGSYLFLHPVNEITEISVVAISFAASGEIVQDTVIEITDTNDFLEKFKEVDCYVYFGDPVGITEEGTESVAIKILYANGEYELINWQGQSKYTQKKGFNYYAGYCVFDREEFLELIKATSVN